MHDEKSFCLYVFFDGFWYFLDVCVCGLWWFGYEWGVSAGGFQSICSCFCRRVFMNDFTWDYTGDFTWDFIWGVFDTCARLYLRFYLLFVVFLYLYNIIYIYLLYCLWLYLGLPVLFLDIWLVCLCFAFVWAFAKHCEATQVNFTYLPWLSYIICYL